MNKVRFLQKTSRLWNVLILLCLLAMSFGFVANTQAMSTQTAVTPTPEEHPDVVGGAPADPGEYPWQVALVDGTSTDFYGTQFCGGSLVASQWVLTAAHCITEDNGSISPVGSLDVVAGIYNLDTPAAGYQRRDVIQIIRHPSWSEVTYDSDLALLKLNSPVTIGGSGETKTAVIPLVPALIGDLTGVNAWVTGWGNTESIPEWPTQLHEVQLPIIANSTCNDASHYNGQITANMLCAGYDAGGHDSCQGDSGGPMVVSSSGQWKLAGIVSWGDGCAEPFSPGVYTRVSQYESWITSIMNNTLKVWSGTTNYGYPMSFYVDQTGPSWKWFQIKASFTATSCYNVSGTFETTFPGPGNIVNNQFNVSTSTFSANGQFTSATTATGTYSFTNYSIAIGLPFPPYICFYPFSQSGTWNASLPTLPVTISGNAGVAGVTLSYFDGTPKTVNTDGNGNYTFIVPYGWSGTVTPSRTGFSFAPASQTYTNLAADQSGQNYLASWVGGVSITSDQNVVAVGRPHIGNEVASYDGFAAGSLSSYVPMLFKTAFGSYDSALYIQNVHASNTANITIKYYDNNGVLNCTKGDTISALSSKGYWLPAATCDSGSLPVGWTGGVVVTSNQPIVAVGRPHVGGEVMTYDGFPSGSLSAYVPMLFNGAFGGSYNAAFYLQNTHATNTANLTIKYYDSNGVLNCTKADTLAALASKGYWVPAATCDTGALPAGWVGGVLVTSDQPIVAVGRPHIGTQVTTYNGFASGSGSSYVPMLFKGAFGGSYDSAFYVQNTHASNTASITLKYYDSNGVLNCTKADTIAPLASKGYWVPSATCDSGSLPAGWVGGVVVTSDQPIVAVGRPHIGTQVTTYNGFTGGTANTYVPMLFRDGFGGSYDSALYLQNVHPSNTANLTIKLYDASGNLACTINDTLAALASKGYWLPALLCPP